MFAGDIVYTERILGVLDYSNSKSWIKTYATDKDIFYSDDLCIAIWEEYGNQHKNIGNRITSMIEKYNLPIRRVGTHNKRALYSIVLETVH